MVEPREDHGVALLSDGSVLVSAGRKVDYPPALLASSEVYDWTTGTWSPTGSLNTARFLFYDLVVLDNDKVLIAGGSHDAGSGGFASAELYDPVTGTWAYTGSLNNARRASRLTLLDDGRVLAIGGSYGSAGSQFLSSCEIYDPETEVWSLTGNLNIAREWHMAAKLQDGRVLIAGGEGTRGVAGNTAEIYDPSSETWSTTGSMSVGRQHASMTVLPDGNVLVVGGWNSDTFLSSVELYDPSTGMWTSQSSLHFARAHHSATLLSDGRVFIAGGNTEAGSLASSEIYDRAADEWALDANFQVDRAQHVTAMSPDGQILAAGGWTGHPATGLLKSCELYR